MRLHYLDWGNESAPPLLLIHGGRDHCRSWDWVAERLQPRWHVVAPDLRGHGDSEWAADGQYARSSFVYDLAQLIHQLRLAPVTIVAHSMGGHIALRYTGIYPENVRKIVAIEGLGWAPRLQAERAAIPRHERMRQWIDQQRNLAAHRPRRYASVDEALARMREANAHLSAEQALHLTRHGVSQNEDGTFSWKFDPYARVFPPSDMSERDIEALYARITCPTLLVYGKDSWASNPEKDGRLRVFRDARVVSVEGAGHWVHHDRLEVFMQHLHDFL